MTRRAGARGSFELTRGIAATWWYTASAVLLFELFAATSWTTWAALVATGPAAVAVAISCATWFACTVVLLLAYRHRVASVPSCRRGSSPRSSRPWHAGPSCSR